MNNCVEVAKIFKVFSDETRLKIISLLQTGEKCACDLLDCLVISQSTLSHHMSLLVNSDIVTLRKDGKWSYYSINEKKAKNVINMLTDLLSVDEQLAQIKRECV